MTTRALARTALAGALLSTLGAAPAHAAEPPPQFTEATLNVHNGTAHRLIRADVDQALDLASVVRFQEVYPPSRAPVRAAVAARPSWRLAFGGRELGIAWDAHIWRLVRPMQVINPMPASGRWGSRALVWVVLRHRATRATFRIASMHADPGCHGWANAYLLRAEVWALYRLDVRPWPVLLGGDANCRSWNGVRLFRPDPLASIDRLLVSKGARLRALRRWSLPAFSDHRLHLQTLRMRKGPDRA